MSDPVARLNAALEGRYAIERELGEGGMATVYLADDLKHERKVALKVLKPELAAVVGAERFLAEIKTTANLQHPHILALFDSGEADGVVFYVMPYVEGDTLKDRLDREHQLPVTDAIDIATDMAEALDYAHRQGVIHRDIKPANVLMLEGKPVISDFGIALAVKNWHPAELSRTTRLRTNALVALVLTVASGCSQRDAPAPTYSGTDSAGVTIYENSEGEWSDATAWRLSSEPILTIGAFDGPEEYLLFQASGARRLSNGNIVITNGGTHELRFYDPDGTHLRSVGREGEGPGEFRSLGEPWSLGSDSIAVWDSRNARLTVFDVDGELGRSFRLDPIPETFRPTPQGILADHSLLIAATIGVASPPPMGIYRDSILYARYSPEGAPVATFIRRQGREFFAQDLGGGRYGSMGLPYGLNPTAIVFGDRWYYGSSESWEIGVYSPDGALTHLYRRDEPNQPVTQDTEDEDRESVSGSGNAAPSPGSGFSMSPPIPETMPAYESFMVSDDGSLWVENYTYVFSNEQPSWAVFRDDGRYLGDVETPMGAQPTHIGDDFVLVIWEDELEVQQVQMYELIKP